MTTVANETTKARLDAAGLRFDNTYARELDGLYVRVQPAAAPAPAWVRFNRDLAAELGLDPDALAAPEGAALFAGNLLPAGAEPIAQAYAGHQFGGFSPQLGDGRAVLLGEVVDRSGRRADIALKGSGRTPFSRGGDGKAALGPVLREYLIGEAMHALGVPTTRALAAVRTGEAVFRETPLPGAVLARVAASHLRVGTFQFFAARRDLERLQRLADYAIRRHDPDLARIEPAGDRYLALLCAVAERQAALIARWMNVGFIHGVMNTDNMTISGETIDYGPCAFLEAYDPTTVFSSIDTGGRYAYGRQPAIARWNLARLAEALLPLIDDDPQAAVRRASPVLEAFPGRFEAHRLQGLRAKLGLTGPEGPESRAGREAREGGRGQGAGGDGDRGRVEDDAALARDWLALLEADRVDFTLAWRQLADAVASPGDALGGEPGDAARPDALRSLFTDRAGLEDWLARWRARAAREGREGTARAEAMRRVNPIVIARNHRVEEALAAAVQHDDLVPFERLLAALARPFEARADEADLAEPAPPAVTAAYRTFCGT